MFANNSQKSFEPFVQHLALVPHQLKEKKKVIRSSVPVLKVRESVTQCDPLYPDLYRKWALYYDQPIAAHLFSRKDLEVLLDHHYLHYPTKSKTTKLTLMESLKEIHLATGLMAPPQTSVPSSQVRAPPKLNVPSKENPILTQSQAVENNSQSNLSLVPFDSENTVDSDDEFFTSSNSDEVFFIDSNLETPFSTPTSCMKTLLEDDTTDDDLSSPFQRERTVNKEELEKEETLIRKPLTIPWDKLQKGLSQDVTPLHSPATPFLADRFPTQAQAPFMSKEVVPPSISIAKQPTTTTSASDAFPTVDPQANQVEKTSYPKKKLSPQGKVIKMVSGGDINVESDSVSLTKKITSEPDAAEKLNERKQKENKEKTKKKKEKKGESEKERGGVERKEKKRKREEKEKEKEKEKESEKKEEKKSEKKEKKKKEKEKEKEKKINGKKSEVIEVVDTESEKESEKEIKKRSKKKSEGDDVSKKRKQEPIAPIEENKCEQLKKKRGRPGKSAPSSILPNNSTQLSESWPAPENVVTQAQGNSKRVVKKPKLQANEATINPPLPSNQSNKTSTKKTTPNKNPTPNTKNRNQNNTSPPPSQESPQKRLLRKRKPPPTTDNQTSPPNPQSKPSAIAPKLPLKRKPINKSQNDNPFKRILRKREPPKTTPANKNNNQACTTRVLRKRNPPQPQKNNHNQNKQQTQTQTQRVLRKRPAKVQNDESETESEFESQTETESEKEEGELEVESNNELESKKDTEIKIKTKPKAKKQRQLPKTPPLKPKPAPTTTKQTKAQQQPSNNSKTKTNTQKRSETFVPQTSSFPTNNVQTLEIYNPTNFYNQFPFFRPTPSSSFGTTTTYSKVTMIFETTTTTTTPCNFP